MPLSSGHYCPVRLIRAVSTALLLALLLVLHPAHGLAKNRTNLLTAHSAFIFNFLLFTEWPPSTFSNSKQPLQICIIGNQPLTRKFQKLIKKRPNFAHPLQIISLPASADSAEIQSCHLIYIDHSQQHAIADILSKTSGHAILTVSNITSFCQRGGMIHLIRRGNKFIFNINRQTGKENGLKFRSQLLRYTQPIPP